MKDHAKEWNRLCKKASVEQDPHKVRGLVAKIFQFLAAEQKRQRGNAPSKRAD
jgi:hypothetical protein